MSSTTTYVVGRSDIFILFVAERNQDLPRLIDWTNVVELISRKTGNGVVGGDVLD